jgi:rod shape-determining protein MreC
VYSALRNPIAFSRDVSQVFLDLWHFHRNAEELASLKRAAGPPDPGGFQTQELLLENQRLNQMLELHRVIPLNMEKALFARVISRSPSAWNRIFLIDKGSQHGIRVNSPVLSERSLIGKIVEVGPTVSKVLLVTDPNSRIGALIQRTRHQGILYGTFSGECRMKYLSVDAQINSGDIVESAGYGGFLPKGIIVGKIVKVWKEPGQIYQVAEVKPLMDLSRVEEVACLV